MPATANTLIKYGDLMDGVYTSLLSVLKNVGSDYDSSVPDVLRYPYTSTYQSFPTDGRGYVPRVVWTNSESLAVVSAEQFQTDFEDYCSTYGLTNDVHKDTMITMATAVKYLTAVLTFVTSRFVTVYSPFTTDTAIFYFHQNPINSDSIGVTSEVSMSNDGISWLLDRIMSAAKNPSKSFVAIERYDLYGN